VAQSKTRVLIVDDDSLLLSRWQRACSRSGVEVIAASSLREARKQLDLHARRPFDCVLTEVTLPDGSGLDLLEDLRTLETRPSLAIVSGHVDNPLALILHRRSIAFLSKPLALTDLLTLINDLALSRKPQALLRVGINAVSAYAAAFQLTRREREVLDHCVAGFGREETAAALGISVGTVHRTWLRILARTGNATQDATLRHLIRHIAEVPIDATTAAPSAQKPRFERQSSPPERVSGIHVKSSGPSTARDLTVRPAPRRR